MFGLREREAGGMQITPFGVIPGGAKRREGDHTRGGWRLDRAGIAASYY